MLVAVKTETLINTPWDATLVPCSVLLGLNRVQRLSDLQKKTCFNSSKGGRIQLPTPIAVDTHNLFGSSGIGQKCYLSEKLPFLNMDKSYCVRQRASFFLSAMNYRVSKGYYL